MFPDNTLFCVNHWKLSIRSESPGFRERIGARSGPIGDFGAPPARPATAGAAPGAHNRAPYIVARGPAAFGLDAGGPRCHSLTRIGGVAAYEDSDT